MTSTYSITALMADIAASNNGRLISMSMTGAQMRAAEKAVARGLVTKYFMMFPGFGAVTAYAAA